MRLTQLKLVGFKSFVDATIIPLPSQLVGVVGPNGCGKSNIIDAVRWVLGEARASELRGESMQDVIFNGSGMRKPAARAAVEMVFDNSEGRPAGQWSAYTEIAVRRVLTRDGASSYFINNCQVRRRDIHDIFLGTGLGARGYAIIGQGMINRLIEARPEELRVFLEEAAGISRYKERRRETENRLVDTRENLTRLQDILRELNAQLEKLETQAEVARQYRSLQADGEQKQHVLWFLKEAGARAEREKKTQDISQAQTQLDAAMTALRACEAAQESRRQVHYAASDKTHTLQGQFYEANAQISRLEAEIRHVAEASHRLQARREQLHRQIGEWDVQHAHCRDQLSQAEDDSAASADRAQQARAQRDAAQAALPALETQLQEAAQSRETRRRALAHIEQELALVTQRQEHADQQLRTLTQRRERLQQDHRQLQQADTPRLQQLEGELVQGQKQLEEAQHTLQALEARLPEIDAQRVQAQAVMQHNAQVATRLDARLAALVKLQEDVQKQGALEPWVAKYQLTSLGRLWQKLQVETGWETAVEAILRECTVAVEVESLDQIQAFAHDAPPGRLAFYQVPMAPPSYVPAEKGLQPLMARLRVTDADLRPLLHAWLQDVYVAETLAQALAGREVLPAGGVYVVKDGHRVDAHSVSFYAADSEQAGLLARQQEITNLQRELKAQHLIADQGREEVARADTAWQQVSQALVAARQRVAELTHRLHDLKLDAARLQQQVEQAAERSRQLREDLADLVEQEESLRGQREEACTHIETLRLALTAREAEVVAADHASATFITQVEAARTQLRDCERAVHEAEFAQRGIAARMQDLQRNQQLAVAQSQRAQEDLTALQDELATLTVDEAQAALQDALALRTESEDALTAARIEMDNLAAQLRSADEDKMRLEQSLEPHRARIMELQLQEQAARLAEEQFGEQLNAQAIDRAALQQKLDTLPETWRRIPWLQSEVTRLSRQIEALGAVNLAALDELTSARERQQFLETQHQDVLTAITTLEDAIRKIDRETRELLQETFNRVNGHFGELFPQLFGGGEAKLVMTGDEILDAGIQVMAQPPGKRNSTIHLLSGGEKALTATALVFALFRLNPAPFCLLDEVDAPLDDANTERYAKLVSMMSAQTQFLFISHNKIAMQMAEHLVGVTMQEQGVSRIVAVDAGFFH